MTERNHAILSEACELVANFPRYSSRIERGTLWIERSDRTSPSIWVGAADNDFTLGVAGWHEHFDTSAEALECLRWVLAGNCRLKTLLAGPTPYRWILEYLAGGEWRAVSETGLLFFPYWRKRRTEYIEL